MTPWPGDDEASRELAAAARRSNAAGSADVRIEMDAPFSAESTTLLGTVDFASGRCRLDGPAAHLVLVGPETYERQEDGRWTHRAGAAGTWELAHPQWALTALASAVDRAVRTGPHGYDVALDRAALHRLTTVGVHQGWTVTASVELDGEKRVRRAALVFDDPAEPDGSMHHTVQFAYRGTAQDIELPPGHLTVEFSEYVRQAH